MSHNKLARRVRRLEDKHRRDVTALKQEIVRLRIDLTPVDEAAVHTALLLVHSPSTATVDDELGEQDEAADHILRIDLTGDGEP